MPIGDRIDAVRKTYEIENSGDEDLARLGIFYAEMQREGLALKQRYDLPLVDTIGITAHRSKRD